MMASELQSWKEIADYLYYFSPQGKFRRVSPSNGYLIAHEKMHREGAVDHAFSREEQRAIGQDVIILSPSHELTGPAFQPNSNLK